MKSRSVSAWLLLVGMLISASRVIAADIRFEGIVQGPIQEEVRFRLAGEIEAGDTRRMEAALAAATVTHEDGPSRKFVISLDSPGGSYQEGLDLAVELRRRGIATVVRTGNSCASACALAFLGGTSTPGDPTPLSDDAPLPSQSPDRSLEPGAVLGFHAPYLVLPNGTYDATTVEAAYRSAVDSISRLVALAGSLYVSPLELPRLLKPGQDEMLLADDVDTVRYLGIGYSDYSYQIRTKPGITQSMIVNACLNRYYHLQRRSSAEGYAKAVAAMDEFVEGSKLMEDGEADKAFGTLMLRQGTVKVGLAYLPIAKTNDGKSFIWCLFSSGPNDPETFYKPAGTIEELFAEVKAGADLWKFKQSISTINLGTGNWIDDMIRAIDLVPPQTKLNDVSKTLDGYLAKEKVLLRSH